MPNYAFTFKKDDIFVEFFSTDKESVEKQFKIWVENASDYTKEKLKKQPKAPEVETEQKSEPKADKPAKVAEEKSPKKPEPTKKVKSEDKPATKPHPEEKIKPVKEKFEQTVEQKNEPTVEENIIASPFEEKKEEENVEVFDKASTLLKTINSIKAEPAVEKAPQMPDFESILENSIENSNYEPKKTKDGKFLQLISVKDTKDKFHYFIITAYYLLEYEKLERFSLKQINAKLMQNLSTVVDHTVLQEAINSGLVELVPDLTGISTISEYRLTEKGENFYLNEI